MLAPGFEPMTFRLVCSYHGITFLIGICISPIDHFALIGSWQPVPQGSQWNLVARKQKKLYYDLIRDTFDQETNDRIRIVDSERVVVNILQKPTSQPARPKKARRALRSESKSEPRKPLSLPRLLLATQEISASRESTTAKNVEAIFPFTFCLL